NEHLHIDYWWCLQHCCITGLLVFLLRWHYFLPCDYIDLLHRSSMHLGNWESLHARSGYTNAIPWSASIVSSSFLFFFHLTDDHDEEDDDFLNCLN
ncbi:unnamed protein product, partial [Schistosoma turkestanicum]